MLPRGTATLLMCVIATSLGLAGAPQPVESEAPGYPEGAAIPRNLTPAETEWLATHPLGAARGFSLPSGPVHCVAEYEPMEAVLMAWEGSSSWLTILATMAAQITTVGDADVVVAVDTSSERTSASNTISNAGANMSRVSFVVATTDTIWIRDYGPRYIYEGGVRAVVDHTYNRPRPNDDQYPFVFANWKGHAVYQIPLVHGGGNFHLGALGESWATRLIANENPGLTEPQIIALWQQYQSLATTLTNPFPAGVDSTQHIDMWMQICGDRAVMISDWPVNSGSTQDQICDSTAAAMAAAGWSVVRVPARQSGGVHYTYTNVVMCNDLVLIPMYTNSVISPYNAQALAAWQAAAPGKTITQVNSQAIVSAAGVLHCIVMHVPAPMGGSNPTLYLRNLRGGETLEPGQQVAINWIADDDAGVSSVDILLSTDSGATFDAVIAGAAANDGEHVWTVPDVYAPGARLRLVARDADGNLGSDESDSDILINGAAPCPGDVDGSGNVDLTDVSLLLSAFGTCFGEAGYQPAADLTEDGCVALDDLSVQLASFGEACP